jgi:hypothetical protein
VSELLHLSEHELLQSMLGELAETRHLMERLLMVDSGEFIAVPLPWRLGVNGHQSKTWRSDGGEFAAVQVDNPNASPLAVRFDGTQPTLASADAIIPPYSGRILVRRFIEVSVGFDPSVALAGATNVYVTVYSRPITPGTYTLAPGAAEPVQGPAPITAAGVPLGTFPVDHPYTKGKLANAVAINAAQTLTFDLVTAGYAELIIYWILSGTAAGDLTNFLNAYQDDGATLITVNNPATKTNSAPALGGGLVEAWRSYDLCGLDKVKIGALNNNAAAQTLTIGYWLQK